ncbi:hypothetical protein B9Z55_028822 [Caenorhabditis nigoni]|nr:hypothetical protein B9Z55_028822 [Caenorhabditis nigoni]
MYYVFNTHKGPFGVEKSNSRSKGDDYQRDLAMCRGVYRCAVEHYSKLQRGGPFFHYFQNKFRSLSKLDAENCLGIYAYQHGKHVSTPIHFVLSPDQLRGIREISEWTVARLTVRNVEIDGCKELETRGNSEESVEIAEKHILRILRENGGCLLSIIIQFL